MRVQFISVYLFLSIISLNGSLEAQIRDPNLQWRTISVSDFKIHYHKPLGELAQRVAVIVEKANLRLEKALGFTIDDKIEIVISDHTDNAQGIAQVIPRNVIWLYAASPDDLSVMGDYNDWLTQLIVHEHTHILHLNQIGGIPAIINSIIGKTYAPNKAQPLWFTEGLAVYQESSQTSGGRLRSSLFDMYLRMDALEDRLLRIDQISNITNRWPHGTIPYLYGSRFVQFIASVYGDRALTQIGNDYGRQTLPYGLNRIARRATGRSFVELYEDFLNSLKKQYANQLKMVAKDGIIEGLPITDQGETVRAPRFLPDGRLIYYASDGHSHGQIRFRNGEEIVRCIGSSTPAPHPNGRFIFFDRVSPYNDIYSFHDLYRYDLITEETIRLTWGMRAREPDISPNGRLIAYIIQKSGTSHLAVAELGNIKNSQKIIIRSHQYEQVYTPRWSPDGQTIAFSRWRRGGYRDIVLVEIKTGRIYPITSDRAMDTGPEWSRDGKWLYFSSDREGIANIYAFNLHTGLTYRVTNVVSGAYQPVVDPDGNHLVYVGYRSKGFDIYRLALETDQFRSAKHYIPTRPVVDSLPETDRITDRPYQPFPSLWPDYYRIDFVPDDFGYQLSIGVNGSDTVGFHAYDIITGLSLENMEPVFEAGYSYMRWPAIPTVRIYRRIGIQKESEFAEESRTWIESVVGSSLGVSYEFPADFHSESIGFSYSLFDTKREETLENSGFDPNLPPPSLPETGTVPSVRLTWKFSSTERYRYDISTSKGQSIRLSLGMTDPVLGSTYQQISFRWSFRQFIPLPWFLHHVFAIHYLGGLSGGDDDRRSVFALGGFPDSFSQGSSLYDLIFAGIIPSLGGEALRGYKANDRSGDAFHLIQSEYRFPVWRTEAGVYTLPIYIKQLYALFFTDYGDAFSEQFDLSKFRVGVGGELLTQLIIGYHLLLTIRTGIARGLSEGGITQFYFHIGTPF